MRVMEIPGTVITLTIICHMLALNVRSYIDCGHLHTEVRSCDTNLGPVNITIMVKVIKTGRNIGI